MNYLKGDGAGLFVVLTPFGGMNLGLAHLRMLIERLRSKLSAAVFTDFFNTSQIHAFSR